jgi:hypothetical protein
MTTVQGKLESVLVELDKRLVQPEGHPDYFLTAFWDPSQNRTFMQWIRKGAEDSDAGEFTEVAHDQVSEWLKHPLLHAPFPVKLATRKSAPA